MMRILEHWVSAFIQDRRVGNKAPGTILFYTEKLHYFLSHANNRGVFTMDQITPQLIRDYLVQAEQDGHNPGGIHACYRTLKTFLRWYELEEEPDGWKNPIRNIRAPKVSVEPLLPADIKVLQLLLDSCKNNYTGKRDQAIILTLMDTGVRASELCHIDLGDVCFARNCILIRNGKGRKPRTVFIGQTTLMALLKYLTVRRTSGCTSLFTGDSGDPLRYEGLRMILRRRSATAGVPPPTIHSFRRYFAITYLRNGGDIFTLQKLLGHSDLQTMRRYLAQIDDDLERGHKLFGPVDHLRVSPSSASQDCHATTMGTRP